MKEIGLSVGKVTYKESAQYADGTIISQSPSSPKKVDKGTKVNLVVCRKSEAEKAAESANEAPNTSGMTLDEAEKALESAGYSVGSVANLDASKDSSQAVVTAQAAGDGKVVNLTVEYPGSQSSQSTGSDGSANNQERPVHRITGRSTSAFLPALRTSMFKSSYPMITAHASSTTAISPAATTFQRASAGPGRPGSKSISIIR